MWKKFGVVVLLLLFCLSFCEAQDVHLNSVDEGDVLTVTFIYVGEILDHGFNYAFDLARNALQVHYKYDVWCYYEIVNAHNKEATKQTIAAAAEKSKIVITTSSELRAVTVELADVYINTSFLMAGGESNQTNVGIYQTVNYDARYLTGILAAMKSNTNIICFLCAHRYPYLVAGFNAWVLGARWVKPDIKAYIAFTDSWSNVESESLAVNRMIDAGCDVVNGQTNNIKWQYEAKNRSVFSMGINSDIRLLVGGDYVLTSVVNDYTKIFIQYFDAFMFEKRFLSGVSFYTMANEGVVVTDFGRNVTRNESRSVFNNQERVTEDKFFCGPIYSSSLCNTTYCYEQRELIVEQDVCIPNINLTNMRAFLLEGVTDFGTIIAPPAQPTSAPEPRVIIRGMGALDIALIVVGGLIVVLVVSGFTICKVRQNKAATVKVLKQLEEGQKKNYKIMFNELKINRKIGAGNFGIVYAGEYRGADVAIKRLKQQDMQKQQIQEFTQEVSVMVGLRHPNIVLLMGVCNEPPNLCIVTEYMPQGSLHSVIHNEQVHFTPGIVKTMVLDMLKGLQFIHSAGLLHRDLKSPNLLVDRRGNLKLADFGLTILQTQSTDCMVHVSVPWTAPEIFNNNPYTAKADVYSVGIIMWEILTRNVPYSDIMPAAIPRAVLHKKRPEMPLVTPSLSLPGLIPLIEKCWHHNPDDRPDIAEIRRDVELIEIFDGSESRPSRSRRERIDVVGGMILERGERDGEREDDIWDTNEKSTMSSSSSASTVSIVLPKMAAPAGLVTFVYLDVPESTHLWEWNSYVMYKSLCILHQTVELLIFKHRGFLSKNDGDSYLLAFGETTDAVAFSIDFHLELLKQDWPLELLSNIHAQEEDYGNGIIWRGLRVRLAVHAGSVQRAQGSQIGQILYFGHAVDLTVKLGRLGLPGQSLMTDQVRKLIGNTGNRIINQSAIVDLQTKPYKVYQLTFHTLLSREFNPPLVNFDEIASSIAYNELLSKPERWIIPMKELKMGEKIGSGSFGETFLASHLGREVAIKVFPVANLKPVINLELRMEMVDMVKLSHPNVVGMYGMCLQDTIGLVQDFVPRSSLHSLLRSSEDLSWDRKLALAQGIAAGMTYLHSNDILHYDIKPSNFLLTNNFEVKIVDLGFARIKTQYQTTTQCGSVAWTAPEVFEGEVYSKLSEVYSFGIVLWEIITRENAWEGIHAVKIADMVSQGQRPSIVDIVHTCSKVPALIKLATQCWNPKREERPSFNIIADILATIK